jgi:hypothetical protein
MRKALGVLFAASLLVSVAVAASSPAGSAVNTKLPKCSKITGSQSFTPGLPVLGDKKLVKPKTATSFVISGCTGAPGITKGTSSSNSVAKTATNCNKLFADIGKPAKPAVGIIKWSNGQTSTASSVLTVTGAKGASLTATLVTTYTKGLGVGKKSTVKVLATPNKGWCGLTKPAKPFTKTTFKSTSVK